MLLGYLLLKGRDMKRAIIIISGIAACLAISMFFLLREPKLKVVVIDVNVLRQEFFYRIAKDDANAAENLQQEIKEFSIDFVEFQEQVQKIALTKGYIVLRKDLVMGGAEDITPQAIKLLEDIRKK